MFHEADGGSVDVELLAECGAVAQRLRSLERSWSIELKDLQRKSLRSYGRPPLPSSHSITQKLNEIFDFADSELVVKDAHKSDDPEFAGRLRQLEDTVIKIHCQQELQRQKRATTTRKALVQSNMNYSTAAATKNNNNDLTTSPTGIHELRDDQPPLESLSHSCSSGGGNSARDNNNKSSTMAEDAELSQSNCIYHQQLQLCDEISNDDLKMLLRELKRKVDFTEKMNWLCKFDPRRPSCDVLLRVRKLDLRFPSGPV